MKTYTRDELKDGTEGEVLLLEIIKANHTPEDDTKIRMYQNRFTLGFTEQRKCFATYGNIYLSYIVETIIFKPGEKFKVGTSITEIHIYENEEEYSAIRNKALNLN